jgi:DNA-directed RNA polymerase specialized sigma24 family protein
MKSIPIVDGSPAAVARAIAARLRGISCAREIRERFDRLHPRVRAGDARARDEVHELLAPAVFRHLRSWPRAAAESDEVLHEVADGVVFEKYLEHPERYDAGRGHPLWWMVRMAKNALVDRWRRRRDAIDLAARVGLDLDPFIPPAAQAVDPADPIEGAERLAEGQRRLRIVLPDPVDRRFALLHFAKAPVEEQAAVIGAGDLPLDQQRKLVHRRWRCIHMRLERLAAASVTSGGGAPYMEKGGRVPVGSGNANPAGFGFESRRAR